MGKQTSPKFLLFMFALVMAAILCAGGLQGYKTLSEKAKQQRLVTESILRWKKSFLALSGTQDRWNKTFVKGSTIRDWRALKSMLDLNAYGLTAAGEALGFKTDLEVTSNGIPLKLKKVCLVTGGGHFSILASSYEQLLVGVERLSHRRDLFIDNVSIVGDKQVPEALISDLCIFVRS